MAELDLDQGNFLERTPSGGSRYGIHGALGRLPAVWSQRSRCNVEHVHYPSGAPMIVDLITGRVDFGLTSKFVKASQNPDLRQRLSQNGTPITTTTPGRCAGPWPKKW